MFKNTVSEFIYKRTYSRWLDKKARREDWPETVERYISFLTSEINDIPEKTIRKMRNYMLEFSVMPSKKMLLNYLRYQMVLNLVEM